MVRRNSTARVWPTRAPPSRVVRPSSTRQASARPPRSSTPIALSADAITASPGREPRRAPVTTVPALNVPVPACRPSTPRPSRSSPWTLLADGRGPTGHCQPWPRWAPSKSKCAGAAPAARFGGRPDRRPAVGVEAQRRDQELPVRRVPAGVGVVREQQAAARGTSHAHVTRTAEGRAVLEERAGALLPRPEQRARARHAGHVVAAWAAAVTGGVDEVEHPVMAQERRALHEAALPRGICAEQLPRHSCKRQSTWCERSGKDRRGPAAAVAVLLPDEPVRAGLVGHGQWVDLADAAAEEGPLVPVGPAHALGGGHGQAAPAVACERGVVHERASGAAHQLGGPEIVRRPAGPALEHRAHLAPVLRVAGAQHRKRGQPAS